MATGKWAGMVCQLGLGLMGVVACRVTGLGLVELGFSVLGGFGPCWVGGLNRPGIWASRWEVGKAVLGLV